jgi:hypothetical protein
MARKPAVPKDPKKYAFAVEKGFAPRNIPSRPLFGRSLMEFEKKFKDKIEKARMQILASWR